MLTQTLSSPDPKALADIERYDVSEDGETWRPYDPKRDKSRPLHRRIVFAQLED